MVGDGSAIVWRAALVWAKRPDPAGSIDCPSSEAIVYLDDYGRTWFGPVPFDLEMIATQVPREFGVYQVLAPVQDAWATAYIGIATGDTIHGRLWKHATGRGNWALGRLGDPAAFVCVWYLCDAETAHQIEAHVVTERKPPFNVRPELKHFVPSIAVH
jgi:hypothetical protein